MKKLKLNALAEKNLSEIEMNQVRGGWTCGCMCPDSNNLADSGKSSNYESGKGLDPKKLQEI